MTSRLREMDLNGFLCKHAWRHLKMTLDILVFYCITRTMMRQRQTFWADYSCLSMTKPDSFKKTIQQKKIFHFFGNYFQKFFNFVFACPPPPPFSSAYGTPAAMLWMKLSFLRLNLKLGNGVNLYQMQDLS